jgi:hypothetical protein
MTWGELDILPAPSEVESQAQSRTCMPHACYPTRVRRKRVRCVSQGRQDAYTVRLLPHQGSAHNRVADGVEDGWEWVSAKR